MPQPRVTSNLTGLDSFKTVGKIFMSALKILAEPEGIALRRQKGLNWNDSLFNFAKLSFLEHTILRYRRMERNLFF